MPDGDLLFDVPFGVVRPDRDQLPSACKNWLTVSRWADVANNDFGLTWVTLDAPLIEPGYLSATLLNSQTNPDVWRKHVGRTQRIYSWAMNNHWGTNYRAYQEGPTVFRYILRPHRHKTNPADNAGFSIAFSQPLLVVPSAGQDAARPMFSLSSPDVLVTGLKVSDDGKAIIIRLFEAAGKKQTVSITWGSCQPKSVHFSNTSEQPGSKANQRLSIPAFGLTTLRADL